MRIIYIDEEVDQLEDFQADAELVELFNEVITLLPKDDIQETVEEIISYSPDAVISDFALNHSMVLGYNGNDLLDEIQRYKKNFPCFIRTSHEDDAITDASDANRVYVKAQGADVDLTNSLFKRVIAQINSYQKALASAHEEFDTLKAKLDSEQLNDSEIQRLIELDDFIESSIVDKGKTPSHIKLHALKRFDDLMDKTDKLIHSIEQKLDDGSSNV